MASILGIWDMRVTWSFGLGGGTELKAPDFTFNDDGTWTAGLPQPAQHHGWWLQAGNLALWSDVTGPRVVWSANIQQGPLLANDLTMAGIMSWMNPGNRGTFRARRLFLPDLVVGAAGGAIQEDNRDPLLGPVVDPMPGDGSDRVAQSSS